MGYGFKVKPRASEGYSPKARTQMELYVRSHWPTSYQRSDGCFVLCDSAEYRDEIIVANTVDYVRDIDPDALFDDELSRGDQAQHQSVAHPGSRDRSPSSSGKLALDSAGCHAPAE